MMRILICIFISSIISVFNIKSENLSDYVNPLIGTAAKTDGGVLPSVVVPFGKTHFTPMTQKNNIGCPPYYYEKNQLIGFMASHQSAVWMGDFGNISFFPTIGEPNLNFENNKLWFNHNNEISKPYYYMVNTKTLDKKYNIKAEIAGDANSGIFKFTYDSNIEQGLLIEISRELGSAGYVEIDTIKNEVYGYNPDRQDAYLGPPLENFKSYFVIKFNKKIKDFGTWNRSGKYHRNISQKDEVLGVYLTFENNNKSLEVRLSNSFINMEQAKENMKRELEGKTFDNLKDSGRKKWNELLGRIQVKDVPDSTKTILYTALYHTMLFPRIMSEYERYYSAFDDQIHDGEFYNTYSLWDTFRALHPFLILIVPERVDSMINSLLCMYKQGGWLPKWPNPTYTSIMIGTHADAVIADAYIKGFTGYDIDIAYEAVRKNAFQSPYGDSGGDKYYIGDAWNNKKPDIRPSDAGNYWWDRAYWNGGYEARGGLTWYMKYGYVPVDYTSESVSRTVEFSIDDYCIAQMAKKLGKTDDYQILMERSKYYKNLYNNKTKKLAPRYHNGKWYENPENGFTEGSSWTYLFGAMHDVPGMIDMMGGRKNFSEMLDKNFQENHYRHDNEPGHHYIYLYNWTNEAYKTQELAREHSRRNYNANPAFGINGNDDLGQMSAWYIFTCLGFYPVSPASGEYAIGAPQYPEISINLGSKSKKLTVKAINISETNKYIKSVSVNGKQLNKPFLKHNDIKNGGIIEFEMTNKPTKWGRI